MYTVPLEIHTGISLISFIHYSKQPAIVREVLTKLNCKYFALPVIYLIKIFSQIYIYLSIYKIVYGVNL